MTHPEKSDQMIAVVGAAGHTGRFVVDELKRRGRRTILIGRDTRRLAGAAGDGYPVRAARMDDAASLDLALSGAAAVINCAGPFLDTAFPVIDAALRAGIPYLDVTAEQATARAIIADRDEAARQAGVVLMPAAAFYGGLADLLAAAAPDASDKVEEVAIAVALDSWHPTRGTRITGERNTAKRLVYENGRLEPIEEPPPRGCWTFPAPFGAQHVIMLPFSETIMIAKRLGAGTVRSWINLAALRDVRDPTTPPPLPSDEKGRSSQLFAMDVLVRAGDRLFRATAGGRDIYAVSAPIVVEAAQRLLAGEAAGRAGVRGLAEIFDARFFLEALGPDAVRVSYGDIAAPLLEREK